MNQKTNNTEEEKAILKQIKELEKKNVLVIIGKPPCTKCKTSIVQKMYWIACSKLEYKNELYLHSINTHMGIVNTIVQKLSSFGIEEIKRKTGIKTINIKNGKHLTVNEIHLVKIPAIKK